MKSIVYDRLLEVQQLAQRSDYLKDMLDELDQSDVYIVFGHIEKDNKSGEDVIPEGTRMVRLNEGLLDGSDPLTEEDLEKVQQALRVVMLKRQDQTEQRIHALLSRPEDPPEEDEATEAAPEPEPEKPARKPRKAPEKTRLMPRVDAVYLHGIAMATRRTIAEAVLPSLLYDMHGFAQRGAMDMLLVPEKTVADVKMHDFLEALQPDLSRLGFTSEIIRHEIQRLGMSETKTSLAISWRTPRPL
ncbi:MAG: hypothetical protein IPK22_11375 [Verrucomicrobiaceae bacterium]|nr:hypothetical protein [Verrucomicrobiaceae bacterium]